MLGAHHAQHPVSTDTGVTITQEAHFVSSQITLAEEVSDDNEVIGCAMTLNKGNFIEGSHGF